MIIRALVVAAAWMAFTSAAHAQGAEECEAQAEAARALDLPRPFAFRINEDAERAVYPDIHCNVRDMTIAVRQEGILRPAYGDSDEVVDEVALFGGIIDEIKRRAGYDAATQAYGNDVRLLVYAHGGLVSHDSAIDHAESLAPFMMADGYLPLFLVWNSNLPPSYWNHLCCVQDGVASDAGVLWYAPARLFGDVVSGFARAPETYLDQGFRFVGSVVDRDDNEYRLMEEDQVEQRTDLHDLIGGLHCPEDGGSDAVRYPYVVLPPFCHGDDRLNGDGFRITPARVQYYALTPARVLTTPPIQGIGTPAWDNMVRRTRSAFRAAPAFVNRRYELDRPVTAAECARLTAFGAQQAVEAQRRSARPEGQTEEEAEEWRRGAFERFFARLDCELRADDGALGQRVSIDLFGHSMGAIVANEMLSKYPEMPYRRVVYMGAASSIRDFLAGPTEAFQRNPKLWFADLTLHPLAEARELNFGGLPPAGSLLEWVDEMFEGPRAIDDVTLGKWRNLRRVMHLFPTDLRRRTLIRVFPLQEQMPEAEFNAECVGPAGRIDRCHPIRHGDFNHFSFWRDCYVFGRMTWPAGAPTDSVAHQPRRCEFGSRAP